MSDRTAFLPAGKEIKKLDRDMGIIHQCSGRTSDGRDFYAYVEMQPSRYLEYVEAMRRGEAVVLSEYGEILEAGFGPVPSETVLKYMNDKYDIDSTFFDELAKFLLHGKTE